MSALNLFPCETLMTFPTIPLSAWAKSTLLRFGLPAFFILLPAHVIGAGIDTPGSYQCWILCSTTWFAHWLFRKLYGANPSLEKASRTCRWIWFPAL